MALKDWKKTGKDAWKGRSGDVVTIYSGTEGYAGRHIVTTRLFLAKTFKTKKQALAYAKAYMRTH